MLYFLLSTLVLTLYIDVVLSLSIITIIIIIIANIIIISDCIHGICTLILREPSSPRLENKFLTIWYLNTNQGLCTYNAIPVLTDFHTCRYHNSQLFSLKPQYQTAVTNSSIGNVIAKYFFFIGKSRPILYTTVNLYFPAINYKWVLTKWSNMTYSKQMLIMQSFILARHPDTYVLLTQGIMGVQRLIKLFASAFCLNDGTN